MPDRSVQFHILSGVPYDEGVRLQKSHAAAMADNPDAPGTIFLIEHEPVITCGRSGDGTNLLVSPDELAKHGIAYREAGRGGDVTYHGPGQWTVYPVLRLAWFNRDLHRYLRLLEECVIVFLAGYGIQAGRRPGLTGTWVENNKLAAVGVAVTRWITWHGFAANIMPDLDNFTRFMHPCGIGASQGGVTSLERVLGKPCGMKDAAMRLRAALLQTLDLTDISKTE